ncbi:YbhB/YbcL family Raf kinase inhibitor-like protein [Affinibrenneria salicis]|uniref:YbhB/YbcL family Raf kinase inhibitor-like protein n=1 Tax=Affinibrenneria salicis TaxID=2590031 RepID=A0A5J5FYX6_9GAMM|nr:YbhB/YbcL family Raf kinase inhibitor-like protein [Affinibrenneria salicis]KAA8999430.1 YbhB/YbcL family Raf kinase inhibitor-like protein [Affinibrenneria salicis]
MIRLTTAQISAAMAFFFSITAAATQPLTVWADDIDPALELPARYAACRLSAPRQISPAAGENPALRWSAGPQGTKSWLLIMQDLDVPQELSDINQAARIIPANAARRAFTHWLLTDIPPEVHAIPAGVEGSARAPQGLPLVKTRYGVRQPNGFAAFMRNGPYGGYKGPCPPWNDEKPHRYKFSVFALNISRAAGRPLTEQSLMQSIQPHILAAGSLQVSYSLHNLNSFAH